jgi:chemotaxis protein histidine kinase CheA
MQVQDEDKFCQPCAAEEEPAKACTKCGRPCGDSKSKAVCKACNSKRAILSTMFGTWPIKPFQDLPAEAQKSIWLSNAKGKVALQALLELKISEVKEERNTTGLKGKYLPLSVYRNIGYNTSSIEQNCNHKWCDILKEEVYLLNVEVVGNESIRRSVRSEIANLRDPSFRGRLSHYASPSKLSPSRRKRSTSASSSSSSSASKDKAKAKAKAKEAAKAEAKERAAAKKQAAKAKARSKKEAAKAKLAAKKEASDAAKAATKREQAYKKQAETEKKREERIYACR